MKWYCITRLQSYSLNNPLPVCSLSFKNLVILAVIKLIPWPPRLGVNFWLRKHFSISLNIEKSLFFGGKLSFFSKITSGFVLLTVLPWCSHVCFYVENKENITKYAKFLLFAVKNIFDKKICRTSAWDNQNS